ncbi:MAG: CRISPR-associated helicase Cas3' [Ignisphaera sp.]|uniref:CRISPR-associated helicase Cas3 n=1 Tax=Ignisphaera aggregans TaxID=334771 RepID=A0A7J3N048_9CREN
MADRIIEVFRTIVEKRIGAYCDPYAHQVKMFEAFKKLAEGEKDVVVLLAPCGSGKTEATVVPYLAQYVEQKVLIPKMIYATPTQTLLYNMRERISNYLKTLRDSKLLDEELSKKLEPEIEHGLDIDPSYLIPRVTISTYDVLIYAWMARRTIPNRPFTTRGAILSSLVVFDEEHLIQDQYLYSQKILPKFIGTIAKVGVPVVVVSATLSDQWINAVKSVVGDDRVEVIEATNNSINVGNLEVKTKDGDSLILDDAINIIKKVVSEAVESREDVLVVLNTVEVAKRIYDEVKGLLENSYKDKFVVLVNADDVRHLIQQNKNVLLCFLHGKLSMIVRKSREKVFEALKSLRKDGEKTWSLVVVATQVAEVGLDYSFDVVITELAPPTAMIQRLMRGGRIKHQKARGIVLPPITINKSDKEDIPSHYVYSKDLMKYSLDWIRKEKQKLSTSNLMNISFLKKVASDEYDHIAQHEKDWVKNLVDKAAKIIETSCYLPPLITSTHIKVMERFKLRLDEYVVLHPVQKDITSDNLEDLKHDLTNYLEDLKPMEIIGRSIRYSIVIHKDDKAENYRVRLPEVAIWPLPNGVGIIPYLKSLRTKEVSYLKLVRNGKTWKIDEPLYILFGKIVLLRKPHNYVEEVGLVEVENVEILMPRYRELR